MPAQVLIALTIVSGVVAVLLVWFLQSSSRREVLSESERLVRWTIVMAVASWIGVATAIWSVWQLRIDLRELVNATISFELDREFDSSEMRRARRTLAKELLGNKQDLSETRPLDFFEKVATYERLGRVDAYTADSSFSYFVERYWPAVQGFVVRFRKAQGDDTYFQDFERLNAGMLERDAREKHRQASQVAPSLSEVQRFLKEEASLP